MHEHFIYVGLVATALAGFFASLILLIILSEHAFGVHTYAHIREKLNQYRFVELTQMEPSDTNHEGDITDTQLRTITTIKLVQSSNDIELQETPTVVVDPIPSEAA